MTNQALPQKSRQMLESHLHRCQNLGLILDKFAPWGDDGKGGWDLSMRSTVRRQQQNQIVTLKGGEAKGLWLSTQRKALNGESPSLFEAARTDLDLMQARQAQWREMVRSGSQGLGQTIDGMILTISTAERLVAGLGASHVLETGLTLERNTGLPYLPGSTVKGAARARGLIEVAAQLNIKLDDTIQEKKKGEIVHTPLLNKLSDLLISEPDETLYASLKSLFSVSDEAREYIQWFRFIFGFQSETGAVCFVDAIYHGNKAPRYAADVMTPHYVNYYTEKGGKPPTEEDNPNPVSFITVDTGNEFAFGFIPRLSAFKIYEESQRKIRILECLDYTAGWLNRGLCRMGIGSKTASGYGFFDPDTFRVFHRPQ